MLSGKEPLIEPNLNGFGQTIPRKALKAQAESNINNIMAASVLGTSETFLERSNSFSQVQMNSFENNVSKIFSNINQSKHPTGSEAIDSGRTITLVSSSEQSIKTERNENVENVPTPPQPEMIFDENSSSSNSTTSSKSRKRKRENEILEQDLLAFGVSVKEEPHTPNPEGKGDTKEKSPAFRLRPRRSAGGSIYNTPSPIFVSPVKKNPRKNSTMSALETAKNLQAFLNVDEESLCSVTAPHFDEPEFVPEELKIQVPMVRSFEKSIVRELDVSVFAELISPLELSTQHVYPNNYISLKIIDRKPIRFVHLNIKSKQYNQIPLLELKAVDLNDRFELTHSQGVFDSPEVKQASKTPLSIYLFGTYAKQAQQLAKDDDVLGIVKFRTVSLVNGNDNSPMHNLRKRNIKGDDENAFVYSYSIVVDSLSDMEMISSAKDEIKGEQNDDHVLLLDKSDNELENLFNNAIRLDEQFEAKWVPFLSFCQSWRAPDDPKNLNQSLYVFQPCVPKFESASITVKM